MDVLIQEPQAEVGRSQYRRYWHALYRRDVAAAERIVDHALAQWAPERIYLRLFAPALSLSGKLWAAGCITYGDEHFVTYHTQRLMRRVRRRLVPAETTGPLAVVGAAGQESHVIGLRMVCDFLQAYNWRIHWLPTADRPVVRRAAADLKPEALLFSIGLDTALTAARRTIADLRASGFTGLVIVGGRAIDKDGSRVAALGADLTARDGLQLVRLLRPRFPAMRRG